MINREKKIELGRKFDLKKNYVNLIELKQKAIPMVLFTFENSAGFVYQLINFRNPNFYPVYAQRGSSWFCRVANSIFLSWNFVL